MKSSKRVCLITGAGGRLGSAFCAQFADRYDIAAVYHQAIPTLASQELQFVDPLEPKKKLPENVYPVFAIKAELTDAKDVARVVETTLAKFGRIDCLVNNAGTYLPCDLLSERAGADLQRQFQINLAAPLALAQQAVLQYWRHQPAEANRKAGGNVVNISSIGGLKVYKHARQGIYSASKAALNFLTLHMAEEFAQWGVRVNALAPNSFPGIVSTESVAKAIAKMDESDKTGIILSMDKDGDLELKNGDMNGRKTKDA
jgi:NAD(P)-dependent dehydrogenase (short-subunit alcohol dehydrogenase family)